MFAVHFDLSLILPCAYSIQIKQAAVYKHEDRHLVKISLIERQVYVRKAKLNSAIRTPPSPPFHH